MNTKVVLCADTESAQHPESIGLEGENLDAQKWLRVFCSAVEARKYLRASKEEKEVWVASSDELDSLNLAAALKKDSRGRGVYLVAFQGSGSQKSRAHAAGVDGMLSQKDLSRRYGDFKQASVCREGHLTQLPEVPRNAMAQKETPLCRAAPHGSTEGGKPLEKKPSPEKAAHVLSVVSATGGSGKSAVAALSALLAQDLGYRTLLIDADMQFGDMAFFLGEKEPLTLDRVLKDPALLQRVNPQIGHPALVAPPPRLEQSEEVMSAFPGFLDAAKMLFDVVVVNTGAFWTEQHVSLLERSSTALFLIDQRPSSIRASKHALDLCSRCGIANRPFLFAVNRCMRHAPMTSIDVSCALQGAHVLELQDGGSEVAELLGAGMPFELIEARNNFCLSIERMLIEVLPNARERVHKEVFGREAKRSRFGRRKKRVACL